MRRNRILVVLIAFALLTAILIAPAAATTITVCPSGCDYSDIRDAVINGANAGDTVFVYNGTYDVGSSFDINKPYLTLTGEGANVVNVNLIGSGILDLCAQGIIVEGLKIIDFGLNSAIAIESGAPDCTYKNCIFENFATNPAINVYGENATFVNNIFSNASGSWGSLYLRAGSDFSTIDNNTFINNTGGRALTIREVNNCTVANNTFTDNTGDGIRIWKVTAVDNTITRNNITSNGGIIYFRDAGEGNKIYLNDFVDNPAGVTYYGTPPTTTYWNSTEEIEYVYGSTTYTNYLGNYWGSDYSGTDADGNGIGDTDYDIPGSGTDKDYRPLMGGYENYPAPGGEEKPDLNVTAITTPANVFATESNVINATIKNNGTGDAGAFNVSLSANGTEIEEVNVTAGLGAGNSTEVSFEWTPAASGTYELCVVADCEGAVDESDETNNVTCMNVEVIVPPLTSITITPDTDITGQVSAYDIIVNTTGFKSLTVSIPAGFSGKTPSGGEQIARADLWWENESAPYYGYVNFTANATDKMDVYAYIGVISATYRGMAVSYSEGAVISIKSPFGTHAERANLTLPTESANGSLTISGLPETITNVTVSIGAFVQNPTNVGDYTFTAKAEGEATGKSAAVTISAPAVPGIIDYAPVSADISDTEDAARTFNITVNQTVNVSWLVNGTEVFNQSDVTGSEYTNMSAVIGTWNVSAVASNTNGTVMQTWIWTVEKLSPCFIATAAYGTSLHEDIDVLRDFRDERLMTNPLGRTFVKTYYETSPPIADALREHEGLRTAVRETLIKPLVYVSRMFVTTDYTD